jgi:hypothetical protein
LFCWQVDRATQDKQSAIVRAQGEAQSARLIGQAIQQNPSFITLRKIEVRCLSVCTETVLAFKVDTKTQLMKSNWPGNKDSSADLNV